MFQYQTGLAKPPDEVVRSKLEAEWVEEFREWAPGRWQYADATWFDFLVNGRPVEIKPRDMDAIRAAADRIPPGQSLIICGGPPSTVGTWYYGARKLGLFDAELRAGCPYRDLLLLDESIPSRILRSADPAAEREWWEAHSVNGWANYVSWSKWLGWPIV